jgi:glycerol-3-phosphate acyltransferase PlsX
MANNTIAIDVMGGDHGYLTSLPAVVRFVKKYSSVNLILVGDQDIVTNYINQNLPKDLRNRVKCVHTTQVVAMDELPHSAMRNKKDSSMRVALDLLKNQEANAVVSAGNTGALMATARYTLRTLPSIDKPAIAKILPTINGKRVCILDLGANVTVDAEQLLQFAIMGAQLMACDGNPNPAIGLLNIGTEAMKGLPVLKEVAKMLKNSGLNFYGNVEGNDVFSGKVDVIVTDGFVGNVALKTIEGVIHMIKDIFKQEIKKSFINKILVLAVIPLLLGLKKRIDPDKYNGAVMIGLNGLVIKSHGGASANSFFYAIEQAYKEVDSGFLNRLKTYLQANPQLFIVDSKPEMMEFKDLSML